MIIIIIVVVVANPRYRAEIVQVTAIFVVFELKLWVIKFFATAHMRVSGEYSCLSGFHLT